MTDISNIYDNVISVCAASLSGYTEIPWPYQLDENPPTLLHKGYGAGIVDGSRSDPNQLYNIMIVSRQVQVIVTNQATFQKDDASSRREQEKTFLESVIGLIRAFELPTNWPSGVIDISYQTDDGITYQDFTNGARIMSVVINLQYRHGETIA
jgi:hypothetical protein